jgi:hypothetical protein
MADLNSEKTEKNINFTKKGSTPEEVFFSQVGKELGTSKEQAS